MIDFARIEEKLEKAFEAETPESFKQWLMTHKLRSILSDLEINLDLSIPIESFNITLESFRQKPFVNGHFKTINNNSPLSTEVTESEFDQAA
ncbi:MAG: hypothetical protein IPN73_13365 [Saprospiraceae bacterium]|nr:hypothetical protein [Saprospiraceae bacterium]